MPSFFWLSQRFIRQGFPQGEKAEKSSRNKFVRAHATIALAMVLVFTLTGAATAQSPAPTEIPSPSLPALPGETRGTGTYFALPNSPYLPVTLASSTSVSLVLTSVPEIVSLLVEANPTAGSAEFTLGGFAANQTYYLYMDNGLNPVSFTTDGSGSFRYTHDLTQPHHIWFRSQPSTKFLSDNPMGGDCSASLGTWSAATKTCTLTHNVNEPIWIQSNGVTLDGAGFQISAPGNYAVYSYAYSYVTVRNVRVANAVHGIVVMGGVGNVIRNNTITGAQYQGINTEQSSNVTVTENSISNASIYCVSIINTSYATVTGNTIAGCPDGIRLNSGNHAVIRQNSISGGQYGIVGPINSYNNTISDNTISSSGYGIFGPYYYSYGNTISGNNISGGQYGIYGPYYYSYSNTISGNTVSSSAYGIYGPYSNSYTNTISNNNITIPIASGYGIYGPSYNSASNMISGNNISGGWFGINGPSEFSNGNTISGNTVSSARYGIAGPWWHSSHNTVRGNTISNSSLVGMYAGHAGTNNQVYNNNFLNNANQIYYEGEYGSSSVFNLAAPIGGNYFSNFDTPAEGCHNANSDSFCDAPFYPSGIGGVDYLPWTSQNGWLDQAPVANAGADFSVDEGTINVTLNGSASSDPNNDPLAFAWSQLSGTTVVLSGAATAYPTFTAPSVTIGGETLSFKLTVTANGKSATDTVDVTVVNINHPPVADAGTDQSVTEGAMVTLDGEGSFDIDNDPFSYKWVQVNGPTVTLSADNVDKPTFTAPVAGTGGAPGVVATLVFELTVDDEYPQDAPAPGYSLANVKDQVTINITNVNNNPIANAGDDKTVDENSIVTLDGSASNDPDNDALSYAWQQTAGPSVTLTGASSATPSFTAPFVNVGGAILTFELTVTDGYGGSATDTMVVNVQNFNDPPLASAARPTIAILWPPNHGMVPVGITGITDPNNNATVVITKVTQDEPTNGLGDGDTPVDAIISPDGSSVLLRAERSGKGNGRVYHIYFTASDFEGNASGMVKVIVPHSKKSDVATDEGELYDSTR